ncbi:hypothetical protein JCM8547_003937 [Rhodosporidiobolus lusitaniae]
MDPLVAAAYNDHFYTTLLGTPALVLVCYVAYSFFFHPLAGLPGPLRAKIGLGGWLTARAFKRDVGWELAKLHEEHGRLVRVGRNTVSAVDPDAVIELYRYGSAFEKSKFYSFFKVSKPSLLATLPNQAHNLARRGVAPAFAMNVVVQLEELVDQCFEDLCATFDGQIASNGGKASIDGSLWFHFLALDTVGEVAFGKSFGLCKTGKDSDDLLPMLDAYTASSCTSGTQPWAHRILHWYITRNLGSSGAAALGAKARKAVAHRLEQAEKAEDDGASLREDVLSKLLKSKGPDGSPLTAEQIMVQANSILGAGSDTTSITMRALLSYIIGSPVVYKKVMDELESAIDGGTAAIPLSYADGKKLDYFQACVKETLRLHPAVGWLLPRIVPKGGVVLAGYHLPAGTEIGMSPYVYHRRSEAFGPDAAVFRPERWLDADEEERKVLERNLITFGAGQRVCIGKNIALMELTKVVPQLLYRYKLSFTPRSPTSPHTLPGQGVDGKQSDDQPWHCESQWFTHQRDFWVDVETRALV